jgi:hypothetical protein
MAEVDRHLEDLQRTKKDKEPKDAIRWWQVNGGHYDQLGMLAIDYLVVRATSVESEKIFNVSGDFSKGRKVTISSSLLQDKVIIVCNPDIVKLIEPPEAALRKDIN